MAFTRENVHEPVSDGDCGACHPPHGADSESLLMLDYPRERFLTYREEAYSLCWECHDAEILFSPPDEEGTAFSDGARNLHLLHIMDRTVTGELGERISHGITCGNCHDPHSTDSPHLVLHQLDCTGVPCLQLDYREEGVGGSCSGGCHLSVSYLP